MGAVCHEIHPGGIRCGLLIITFDTPCREFLYFTAGNFTGMLWD